MASPIHGSASDGSVRERSTCAAQKERRRHDTRHRQDAEKAERDLVQRDHVRAHEETAVDEDVRRVTAPDLPGERSEERDGRERGADGAVGGVRMPLAGSAVGNEHGRQKDQRSGHARQREAAGKQEHEAQELPPELRPCAPPDSDVDKAACADKRQAHRENGRLTEPEKERRRCGCEIHQ